MKKIKNLMSYIVILVTVIYLLLPLAGAALYSVSLNWSDEILPPKYTLQHYQIVFGNSAFWFSLIRSIFISILSVSICLVILLLAIFVVIVHFPKLERIMQVVVIIPYAISGVILAGSLLSLYAGTVFPFSNRIFLLTSSYCIIILPYMYQGIRNSLNTINVDRLLESAEILGASKFVAFFTIIVPNIISGITVAVLLSVAIIFGDFALVNTIAGNIFVTAQYYLKQAMLLSGGQAGAIVMILFGITFIMSASVLYLQSDKSSNKN